MTDQAEKNPLANVPTQQKGIELEGEQKNAYDLMGGVLGLQNKDMYSVIERSEFTDEEIAVFGAMIQTAEHGIGGGERAPLDIPIPWLGERLVYEIRLRRSKNRQSSHEFENIMTEWLRYLRAKEDQKLKETQKMVGTS